MYLSLNNTLFVFATQLFPFPDTVCGFPDVVCSSDVKGGALMIDVYFLLTFAGDTKHILYQNRVQIWTKLINHDVPVITMLYISSAIIGILPA